MSTFLLTIKLKISDRKERIFSRRFKGFSCKSDKPLSKWRATKNYVVVPLSKWRATRNYVVVPLNK